MKTRCLILALCTLYQLAHLGGWGLILLATLQFCKTLLLELMWMMKRQLRELKFKMLLSWFLVTNLMTWMQAAILVEEVAQDVVVPPLKMLLRLLLVSQTLLGQLMMVFPLLLKACLLWAILFVVLVVLLVLWL
jgi:hypothetical protein